MSEMVGRVAIKVFLSHGYPEDDWSKITGAERDEFRRCARVVIEAMRVPTTAMVAAGQPFAQDDEENTRDAWQAMIDEALK